MMKTKVLNIAAISCIVLATLLAFGWAGVELAIYYGNNSLYSNPVFSVIYDVIMFLKNTTVLAIFVALSSATVTVTVLGYGVFAVKEKAKVIKYMEALDYQVDKNAAFYDKTFDVTTPVSAYGQERDAELELRVKYDIALNK